MVKKISPRLTLLSLGLALLLSVSGCKAAPDKKADATAPAGSATAALQPAQPPAAPAGSPAAAPSSSAQSTQAATPAEMPSHAGPAGKPGSPADEAVLKPEKLPAIVARVNGKPVKKEELFQACQVVQLQLAQAGHPVPPSSSFYHRVLDELVAIKLLQQDAKAQGVVASDQEVQQQMAARKRNFPNEDAYKKALAQAGLTDAALREEAGNQIAVQKYVETKLASQVNITDQAAREFYDKNKSQMKSPERVHVRHILVQVEPTAPAADKAKAKAKAEEALKKVQGGEDFAKLAEQYSDDPGSKTHGGDVGFITRGQTVPQFEAAAFALQKPNEIAPLTETRFGYHIIQLIARQPEGVIPYDQVKDRLTAMLKQQAVQKLFQARASELRSKAKVEVYL